MTIYLYIKTHRVTGMKYFGKTKDDPFKYKGSGKYWKRHISTHGYDCDTEIIRECQTNNEVAKWGKYYSALWNIVESEEWANLKPESGDGGETPGAKERMSEMRKGKSPWNKGIAMTESMKEKQRLSHIGKIRPPEAIEKHRAKVLGRKMTEDAKRKISIAHTGKILSTDHKEKISSSLSLYRATNPMKPETPESRKKKSEAALARPVLTCPQCGATGKGGVMYKWHFANCKY